MTDIPSSLQVTTPREVQRALGRWLRLARQRQELTQPMLASKSGVPVATLSRLEREGEGAIHSVVRVLHALGELDGFQAHIQDHVRKAALPRDLSEWRRPIRPRQRVRLPPSHKEGT